MSIAVSILQVQQVKVSREKNDDILPKEIAEVHTHTHTKFILRIHNSLKSFLSCHLTALQHI
jgi:hypothetical protein